MSTNAQWTVFLIVAWIGSCWYFYWMGSLHGSTKAMKKATEHFDDLRGG